MSRIGRAPIAIPAGVEVKIDGNHISVKGPKGTLERDVDPAMILELEGNTLHVKRPNDEKRSCAMHGLTRTLVNDMDITQKVLRDGDIVTIGLMNLEFREN